MTQDWIDFMSVMHDVQNVPHDGETSNMCIDDTNDYNIKRDFYDPEDVIDDDDDLFVLDGADYQEWTPRINRYVLHYGDGAVQIVDFAEDKSFIFCIWTDKSFKLERHAMSNADLKMLQSIVRNTNDITIDPKQILFITNNEYDRLSKVYRKQYHKIAKYDNDLPF